MPAQPGDIGIDRAFAGAGKQAFELRSLQQLERGERQAIQIERRAEVAELRLDEFGGQIFFASLRRTQFAAGGRLLEFAELHAARVVDQQIRRPHRAVNFVLLVQKRQRVERLLEHAADQIGIARPGGDDRGQRALHQFHDDPAALGIDRVHPQHVVVFELGEKLGLAQKLLAVPRIAAAVFIQFLDRHFAAEREVVAAIDHRVRTAPELFEQFVGGMLVHSRTCSVWKERGNARNERPVGMARTTMSRCNIIRSRP